MERKIINKYGIIALIIICIYITLDYFNIFSNITKNLNIEILNIIVNSIVVIFVFMVTYKLVDKKTIEKEEITKKNKLSTLNIMLQEVYSLSLIHILFRNAIYKCVKLKRPLIGEEPLSGKEDGISQYEREYSNGILKIKIHELLPPVRTPYNNKRLENTCQAIGEKYKGLFANKEVIIRGRPPPTPDLAGTPALYIQSPVES